MKGLNVLLIAAIIICVIGLVWVYKTQEWANALAVWSVAKTDICSGHQQKNKKLPTVVPCGVLTTITPPPLPSRAKIASSVVDQAAWTFAVTANASFVSYIGGQKMSPFPSVVVSAPSTSGIAQKTISFRAPKFLYIASDISPLAAIWVSTDATWAVVVIRGTMTMDDLINDLNFNYLNDQTLARFSFAGNVHPGIAQMYSSISKALHAAIPPSVTQLTITGHSLGAGIGFLFAADMVSKSNINVDVYGVAPPRVGDSNFAANLSQRAAHSGSLINVADTVPALPLSYMVNPNAPYTPLQYAHVGNVNVFNNLLTDTISNHMLPAYYQGIKSAKIL